MSDSVSFAINYPRFWRDVTNAQQHATTCSQGLRCVALRLCVASGRTWLVGPYRAWSPNLEWHENSLSACVASKRWHCCPRVPPTCSRCESVRQAGPGLFSSFLLLDLGVVIFSP